MPFQTRADHAMIAPSSSNSGGFSMSAPLQIGLLVFPNVTQLDLTGPVQVFAGVPGAKLHLVWEAHRASPKRFRADADTDHYLRRLSAT
jgi:hypothetical protein